MYADFDPTGKCSIHEGLHTLSVACSGWRAILAPATWECVQCPTKFADENSVQAHSVETGHAYKLAAPAPQVQICNSCGHPTHKPNPCEMCFCLVHRSGAAPAETAQRIAMNRDGSEGERSTPDMPKGHAIQSRPAGETAGEMTPEQRQYSELEARYFRDKLMDAAEIGELRAKVAALERERDTLDQLQSDYVKKFASETALRLDWQRRAEAAEAKLKEMREALRHTVDLKSPWHNPYCEECLNVERLLTDQ